MISLALRINDILMKEIEQFGDQDPIPLLPHHAVSLFEVKYLNRQPEDVLSWYDDSVFKIHGASVLKTLASNLNQTVRLVDVYDVLCKKCPKNIYGENFKADKADRCTLYDSPRFDLDAARILGLTDSFGKTITVNTMLELMAPTYERLLNEDCVVGGNGKDKPLRIYFRFKEDLGKKESIFFKKGPDESRIHEEKK